MKKKTTDMLKKGVLAAAGLLCAASLLTMAVRENAALAQETVNAASETSAGWDDPEPTPTPTSSPPPETQTGGMGGDTGGTGTTGGGEAAPPTPDPESQVSGTNGHTTVSGTNAEIMFPIDAAHFPDDNFRGYVSAELDTDGDGSLSDAELAAVTVIGVESRGIASLQGIEYFPQLTSLYCQYNALEELDLSRNTALNTLDCEVNSLRRLDLSGHAALEYVSCAQNELTELNTGGCANLKLIDCRSNILMRLDLSGNPALETLNCADNHLIALDLSQNPGLKLLQCANNRLTALDVSQNPALTYLTCESNSLQRLDIHANPRLLETVRRGTRSEIYGVVSYSYKTFDEDIYENVLLALNCDSGTELITDDAPQLVVSSERARQGREVTVTVSLKNNPGFNTFTLTAEYDASVLTLQNAATAEALGGSFTFAANTGKVVWQRSSDTMYNGAALALTFLVAEDAPLGKTPVTVSYQTGDICNLEEEDVDFEIVAGGVTVTTHTPGDITGDGAVNNKDLNRLMKYLADSSTPAEADALDVNGDGAVNNKDLNRLMKYLADNTTEIY